MHQKPSYLDWTGRKVAIPPLGERLSDEAVRKINPDEVAVRKSVSSQYFEAVPRALRLKAVRQEFTRALASAALHRTQPGTILLEQEDLIWRMRPDGRTVEAVSFVEGRGARRCQNVVTQNGVPTLFLPPTTLD